MCEENVEYCDHGSSVWFSKLMGVWLCKDKKRLIGSTWMHYNLQWSQVSGIDIETLFHKRRTAAMHYRDWTVGWELKKTQITWISWMIYCSLGTTAYCKCCVTVNFATVCLCVCECPPRVYIFLEKKSEPKLTRRVLLMCTSAIFIFSFPTSN